MSGWLSSVNNLLENLDGQAETVAETVAEQATTTGISSNLRRLNKTIANNASAFTSNITKSNINQNINNNNNNNNNKNIDNYVEEDFLDDDSAFFDSDDFGDDDFFTSDDDFDIDVDDDVDGADRSITADLDADKSGGAIDVPKESAPEPAPVTVLSPSQSPSQSQSQPTNIHRPSNEHLTDEVADVGQRPPDGARSPTATAKAETNEIEKNEKIHGTHPSSMEKPSGNSSSNSRSGVSNVRANQQASSPAKAPNQHESKESKDEAMMVDAEESQKNEVDGNPGTELLEKASSSTTAAAAAAVGSSATSGAVGKLPSSLPPQKGSNGQTDSLGPKAVKDPQHHEQTMDSSISNKNAPVVGRKAQGTSSVPNRSPPPPQKAGPPQKVVAPASIADKTKTEPKNQPSGKKKNPEQKDGIKLLKKQQQQHQQVVASKNKTIQSLESQLVKLREELTKGAGEHETINQRTKDLEEKLRAGEREIEAQAKELIQAGEEMALIRTNAKEEREDLLDDHDDEIEDIQKSHQEALDKTRQEYERTIAEWKERYESEESLRQQEGGDSIRELHDTNKREREALKKLAEVTDERTALQAKLNTVVGHEKALEQQVESSLESAETVAAREQRAREQLDDAAASHARQMAQRQRREAELERTILEMGSALTLAKQQLQQRKPPEGEAASLLGESNQQPIDGSYYKEQFELATEELDTVRVRFTMETQRREALQQQLTEVSMEREQELSLAQSRQQQHDRRATDLESTIHRLQASIRALQRQPGQSGDGIGKTNNGASNAQAIDTLEGATQEIANLTEQLFRQRGLAKSTKSEILALKGRLQAANARAEEAEKDRYNPKNTAPRRSRAYDVEGGSSNNNNNNNAFTVKRRVKGGSSKGVRSIRSALPCFGSGRASADGGAVTEQVALTIDAIDSWMVDTGSFMRQEPYARLGLLLYLMILHLWSFALVVFHTTEVEHGDFGSMDSNPRHWREHT